jgi:CBS domain-containing protein
VLTAKKGQAMTIATILEKKGHQVHCLLAGKSQGEAAECLAEHGIGAVPVVDGDGHILGIFSERDLARSLARAGASALTRAVEEAMTSPAVTVAPGTSILSALAMMSRRRIRHLPVVESGEIRGIVSIGDLVNHRIERIEAEAAAMRDYIQQ